jgi:gas vesicle protein
MTVETDALAEAALRFSDAIRAERTSTLDALANERQAALQIIKALRSESERRTRQASGRFAIGLMLGTAIGAAAIYFINQRTSEEVRLGLTAQVEETGASIGDRLKAALEAGRQAATTHEQDLWAKYRQRLTEKPTPPPYDEPLY